MIRTLRTLAVSAAATIALVATSATSAHAVPGWTTIVSEPDQAYVLVCKKAVDSPYGPLWQINVATLSSPDRIASVTLKVTRNGSQVGSVRLIARDGQWLTGTTHASRLLPDVVEGTAGIGTISSGGGYGGNFGPYTPASQLATCG